MYIKNLNNNKEGYIFNSDIDFSNIKKITGISSFQYCEPKEEKSLMVKKLLFFFKNKYHVLKFDFENELVYINNVVFTVSENIYFVYKKINIKNHFEAIDGIKGFYSYMVENLDPESVFNYHTFKALSVWSNTDPKEI